MYSLTLYYLIGLIAVAFIFSWAGILSYDPWDIFLNVFISISLGLISNYFFAKIFNAVTNRESVFITSLILVLIIPLKFPDNSLFLAAASVMAMASKYLLTVEKRHLFNPAAVAVAGFSLLFPEHSATWWIGTPAMMPFVLIGGLILVRKLKREKMVFTFLFTYFILAGGASVIHSGTFFSLFSILRTSIFQSSLLFFVFAMLTEPLTSPTKKVVQDHFSFLTAILYASPQLRLGAVFTPEITLCLGNIFSFFADPNRRFMLSLKFKRVVSSGTLLFGFEKTKNFNFSPGQYMEWTLPHKKVDNRGNRRYFSIASSPTENDLMIAVKFYVPPSSYKKELIAMQEGQKIIASQISGDFTLPKDLKTPLVFLAGGIGMAPFRGMIKYIIDNKIISDIVIFYSNKKLEDAAFLDLLAEAKSFGVRTILNVTSDSNLPIDWQGKIGRITSQTISEEVPDYNQRIFYISGPQIMVQSLEEMLLGMKISKNKIKTDFFPGFAEGS